MLVLHAAPHPDDELIGAPATLLALRDDGHEIVNVACSLGRPDVAGVRHAELQEACDRVGFTLRVVGNPLSGVPHGPGRERQGAEDALTEELVRLLGELEPGLVVGPSPHDRHPGHEIVARAIRAALERPSGPARWWMWGLWGELPFPTTIVQYGDERLDEIEHGLMAHASQIARNDYRRLVAGRASATTVLAPELAFGFGAGGLPGPYAEATTEVVRDGDGWLLGRGRELDASAPFPEPSRIDVSAWLHLDSDADLLEVARARVR